MTKVAWPSTEPTAGASCSRASWSAAMCGGGYTIMGKDRYGCAAHRSKGNCGNDRTIGRQAIESRVLEGSSTGCWRPSYSRSSPVPTKRSASGAGADGRGGAGGARRQACPGRSQDRRDDSGDRGRALPASDEGADGERWRPRRLGWCRSVGRRRTPRPWRCTPICRRGLSEEGRGTRNHAGRHRARARKPWRRSAR